MNTTIIVVIVMSLIVLYLIVIYNELVNLKSRVSNRFFKFDIELKKRYDLISNLVNISQEYMSDEKETLISVVDARNKASLLLSELKNNMDPNKIDDLSQAEKQLQGALEKLNYVMEIYPDLKVDKKMLELSKELEYIESKVIFYKEAFNDSVKEYNTYKQSFPQVILTGSFGHKYDAKLLD